MLPCVRPPRCACALLQVASRLGALLTPQEARSFELLRAFRLQQRPAEQKAARAKERLLDEMAKGLNRR